MNRQTYDIEMIKVLVLKDWQVYQKQLAGYMAGLLFALCLIGAGKVWSFNLGGLLLIILLISVGYFGVQSLLLNERKEHTEPFIMSLPVTPLDYFWGKLLANLLVYLVPFLIVSLGMTLLILLTALPNGLLVYSLIIFGFMLMSFYVSLSAALVIVSEGWNIFLMMALMSLFGPFVVWLGQIDAIGPFVRTETVFWSTPALALLTAETIVMASAIAISAWRYSKKTVFL